MEEVDAIIAHTLRSIGCDIDENVESLSQFSTELVVEATARCLHVINNDLDLSYKLPPSMSARFRIGTSLATAVQDLGYRGEVGYQTFLYSSEAEIRRVFIFLLEKLPKVSETVEESLGATALLQRAISAEIGRRLRLPWTPSFCKRQGVCWRGSPSRWHREGCSSVESFRGIHLTAPEGLGDLTANIPKETREYYNSHLPYVHRQPRRSCNTAASLLTTNALQHTAQQDWETEWNTLGLPSRLSPEEYKARKRQKLKKRIAEQLQQSVKDTESANSIANQDLTHLISSMSDRVGGASVRSKGSRFTHTEKLQFAQDEEKTAAQVGASREDTEEDLEKKREEEVEQLRKELSDLTSKLDKLQTESKAMVTSSKQMEEDSLQMESSHKEKEEAFKVKKRTMDLLPDAENNIIKLQGVVDASTVRLERLAAEWEKHRVPLEEEYRQLKLMAQSKTSETEKLLEEIQDLRDRMKQLAADARSKDDLYKQLVSEYERMTKDVNRSAYTRRILEIVANIKKQKVGIDQVLIDTRSIQKEINRLSGKLDRTFTVTDELIFKDAKKDEAVRKAYKHLAALHENCSMLMKTVEETGVIMREIRDLEDQIEQESKKKTTDSLEKISEDLQAMRKENTSLVAKYKKQQGNNS